MSPPTKCSYPPAPTSPPIPLVGGRGEERKNVDSPGKVVPSNSLRRESMAHNLPQPRRELESLLSLLSVAMSWQDWATKAPSVPWCGPSRPLRAATDCSGLGIPELALTEIVDLNKSSVELAWSCDVASSSKRWCLTQLCTICLESRMALLSVSRKGLTMKVSVGWVSLSTWFRCPLRVGRVDP